MAKKTKAAKGLFEAPDKKNKKKNEKLIKERLHIYLTTDCIEKIERAQEETGLNRSSCIQILINTGLKHLKTKLLQ